ncbi:hypothetical protein [Streptomyces lydicus]|uniref:hypothetical protein n=1 Tax=Streptomyces lydicus TaxID=47763 RepID=UPI0037166710
MSIDSTRLAEQAPPAFEPRAQYLGAFAAAEQMIAGSPVVPSGISVVTYAQWAPDGMGLDVHLRTPSDVAVFARWIGGHVGTTLQADGLLRTSVTGGYRGTPYLAWALHTDAEWVLRQTEQAGELARQAHEYYDLDEDSAAVVPGCGRVGYLAAGADAEVPA